MRAIDQGRLDVYRVGEQEARTLLAERQLAEYEPSEEERVPVPAPRSPRVISVPGPDAVYGLGPTGTPRQVGGSTVTVELPKRNEMKNLNSALKKTEAAIRDEKDPVRYTRLANRLSILQAAKQELDDDEAPLDPEDPGGEVDDELVCSSCGAKNAHDAVFCSRCGGKVETQPGATSAKKTKVKRIRHTEDHVSVEDDESEEEDESSSSEEDEEEASTRRRRPAAAAQPSWAESMLPASMFPGTSNPVDAERAKLLSRVKDRDQRAFISTQPIEMLRKTVAALSGKAAAK